MNKKDFSKEEEIKKESKVEVKEEDKGEEDTRKRKHGTRRKMKSRKRRYIQDTSQNDPSDIEKENDELRFTENLGSKPQFDESKRSEEINMNVVTTSNGQKRSFSTLMRVLSVFDREDLDAVYQLVMDIYQDKIPEGVHTLMTKEGLVVHILIEKKYPLKKEIVMQMLKLKLESEEERFLNDNLASWLRVGYPRTNSVLNEELSIPEQTATGKGTSNPLMGRSFSKTTKAN
ncbi:hypothetical protein Tco_0954959 [Tanacetum coccineum]|uniref:Uncharacterized protein n=1 Tax=Tanacetum coccineum TaxID=301880 RepID=A0ABQ5E5W9_9ASTR